MNTDTECDDLGALLLDPGWIRFQAYAESVWGDSAVVARMEQAVGLELGDEQAAREHTQALLAAKRHIRALLAWPAQRVAQLQNKAETQPEDEPAPRAAFSRSRTPKRLPRCL